MSTEKDLRDNTRAMNNMASAMVGLTRVVGELNKNLLALAAKEQEPPKGICADYFCSSQGWHDHGEACSNTCSKCGSDRV